MKKTVFTGAAVAIVTPFDDNNKVNYTKLAELIDYQIDNSTDAIVICGTTGEGPTLTHEEHAEAIRFTCKHVNKRVPVIAGTGSNDTAYAIWTFYLRLPAHGAGNRLPRRRGLWL